MKALIWKLSQRIIPNYRRWLLRVVQLLQLFLRQKNEKVRNIHNRSYKCLYSVASIVTLMMFQQRIPSLHIILSIVFQQLIDSVCHYYIIISLHTFIPYIFSISRGKWKRRNWRVLRESLAQKYDRLGWQTKRRRCFGMSIFCSESDWNDERDAFEKPYIYHFLLLLSYHPYMYSESSVIGIHSREGEQEDWGGNLGITQPTFSQREDTRRNVSISRGHRGQGMDNEKHIVL